MNFFGSKTSTPDTYGSPELCVPSVICCDAKFLYVTLESSLTTCAF